MSFGLQAAQEVGVPGVTLRTSSACSLVCYKHVRYLLKRVSYLLKLITLTPIHNGLEALKPTSAPIYALGPLDLLIDQFPLDNSKSLGSNLWKEEPECLQWLNSKEANSVIYVNFGSVAVLTSQQLQELAWGLADSKKNFLWIIRPDLVIGESAILPPEFREETKERGLIARWCPQQQVLTHTSVGGFLTSDGTRFWRACAVGVPILGWPFLADQHINCIYAPREWGVGMEINENVKRHEVEDLVRELMDGEKGKEIRRQAVAWKKMQKRP